MSAQFRTWGIRSYGIQSHGIRSYGIHSYGMRAQSGWITKTLESKPRKGPDSKAERAVIKAWRESHLDVPHTTVRSEVARRASKPGNIKRSSVAFSMTGPHWEVDSVCRVLHAAARAAGIKLT